MAGLRSELKVGILADCDKETIDVFNRWQKACGIKNPNPPEEHTLNKLSELRVNLAAHALRKEKDLWELLSVSWQEPGRSKIIKD